MNNAKRTTTVADYRPFETDEDKFLEWVAKNDDIVGEAFADEARRILVRKYLGRTTPART